MEWILAGLKPGSWRSRVSDPIPANSCLRYVHSLNTTGLDWIELEKALGALDSVYYLKSRRRKSQKRSWMASVHLVLAFLDA